MVKIHTKIDFWQFVYTGSKQTAEFVYTGSQLFVLIPKPEVNKQLMTNKTKWHDVFNSGRNGRRAHAWLIRVEFTLEKYYLRKILRFPQFFKKSSPIRTINVMLIGYLCRVCIKKESYTLIIKAFSRKKKN